MVLVMRADGAAIYRTLESIGNSQVRMPSNDFSFDPVTMLGLAGVTLRFNDSLRKLASGRSNGLLVILLD